jgi:archaetidylinositol phosphate synthase
MRGRGGFSLLDRLRGRLDGFLGAVGKWFSAVGLSPTAWTVVGLLISLLAGLAYWTGGYRGQVLGAVLVLASGWFDIVDGAVARVTSRTSRRGAFLDSTLDRVAEVAVFAGILAGGYTQPLYVLLALSLSLLVSYTRAKADSLGVSLSGVGIGERSERLLVLAIASLVGLVQWGVVVVALIAGYTFLERVYRGARSLA